MKKILVITALRKEYLAVREHLTDIKQEIINDFIIEKGIIKNCKNAKIYIYESGVGREKAAISTENLTREIKPDLTIFIGIAGGIKDLNIGDILVASKVYGFQGGKSGDKFYARPELGKSTKKILERAKAEARKREWTKEIINEVFPVNNKVLVGNIATGDIVLISDSEENPDYQKIKEHYNDTHAIEMEGVGFMEGFYHYNNGECIVLRGISDLLDNKNNESEEIDQERACKFVAGFGFHLIKAFVKNELNNDITKKDKKKLLNLLIIIFSTVSVIFLVTYSFLNKTNKNKKNERRAVVQSTKDTIKEKIDQSNTINIGGSNNKINDISMENKSK